jgi:hypothetical protein
MGMLEIGLGFDSFLNSSNAENFRKNPSARASLTLKFLRFVPYERTHNLLSDLELLLGPLDDSSRKDMEKARTRARSLAAASLTGYLWKHFETKMISFQSFIIVLRDRMRYFSIP